MIYTRFGGVVEIVGNFGSVLPKGFDAPVTLVKVRFIDDAQEERWKFAEFLKADDGWKEIANAISASPVASLNAKDLKLALKQAR